MYTEDGLEAIFWGVREVWVAKVEVLLGVVTLDVFLLVVAVFDDDAVVDAALFVGRRYTMVVIWPSVDVYVSVEYESRWQRFRYGSKGEISIVPPLGSEPCSLMQTLQALRAFVKSEPAAHNCLFNPSVEPIVKASSNDGILALNRWDLEYDRLITASRRTAGTKAHSGYRAAIILPCKEASGQTIDVVWQ